MSPVQGVTNAGDAGPLDLTSCAREPIRIPGFIQPHGVLLALDPTTLVIEQVSENSTLLLGRTPSELIGASPRALLGERQFDDLRAAMSRGTVSGSSSVVAGPHQLPMECIFSRYNDVLLLELHPLNGAPSFDLLDVSVGLDAPLARMARSSGIDGVVRSVATEIRAISGFDRVMVYRFDEDWHGVVLAEDVSTRVQIAYLGLHFPASDIPAQARDLYLLNTLRLIPDIEYVPVAIVPAQNPRLAAPLDLSRSDLRAVSPIHIQYLRNIGVRATLTISIVVHEKLWGLVACHHDSPRYLDHGVRSTCAFFAQMLALKLAGRIDSEALAQRLETGERIAKFLAGWEPKQSLAEALGANWRKLLPIFGADSLFVQSRTGAAIYGTTLSPADLSLVAAQLRAVSKDGIASSSSLCTLDEGAHRFAQAVSGGLYVGLSTTDDSCLIVLRREQRASVKWGGDPNKPVSADSRSGQLTPRASFAIWEELVQNKCLPWSSGELATAANFRAQLLQRQRARDEIGVLAYDALTELPNRQLLDELLKRTLSDAAEAHVLVALLFIDIDRLKRFNDQLGHAAGDRVLRHVAACLSRAAREGDIVGRLGGDEFLVIMPRVSDRSVAETAAQCILDEASRSVAGFEFTDLRVTLSIGISLYPTDASTSEALLTAADAAMFYVKKNGRGAWRTYASAGRSGGPSLAPAQPQTNADVSARTQIAAEPAAAQAGAAAARRSPPSDHHNDVFELTRDELDGLPFGVVTLDRQGKILRFNRSEGEFAHLSARNTIGLDFFADVAPCTNVQAFRGRFDEFAAKQDAGVERFAFAFTFRWGREDVTITLLRKFERSEINIIVDGHLMSESADAATGDQGRPTVAQQGIPTDVDMAMTTRITGYLQPPTGCRLGGAEERELRARIYVDDAPAVQRLVAAAALDRTPYTVEYRTLRPDAVLALVQECGVFASDPGLPGCATILDVTARRQNEEKYRRAAYYDSLTRLPNRALLVERIAAAVDEAEANGRIAAVLVSNLDAFREINDEFGYDIGTRLLPLLALRLGECVRGGDTVARLEGDRFAILLTDVDTGPTVEDAVRNLITAVARPFVLDDRSYYLTLSTGISVAPYDSRAPDALLRFADAAMYAAKQDGRSGFRWYNSEMLVDAAQIASRHNELRLALQNNEFELFYQPIVDVADDRIIAAEALIRWNHPDRGFLGPGKFIALADRTGLIVPLGEWVLREACRQAREWRDLGFTLRICVNVSAVQFRQPNFVKLVASILAENDLSPSWIELELTESVMVEGFGVMMEVLSQLKALGLRLSIDDFGTGYSSLSYLKYFPVDTLKIDRAFVIDIASDQFDRAIATTVLTLANELHFECIVEGVEDREQLDTLRAIGCTIIQGYYFFKPLPAEQLREILGKPLSV